MTSNRVFGILTVIALLALSATAAHAGAGGTPSALTSFFVCKSISGDDAAQRVDVDSTDPNGWGFSLQNVRIGNAILACAFAKLFPGGSTHHTACIGPNDPPGCNEISPNPNNSFTQLKCYSVSVSQNQTGNSPPPSYTVTDQLFPENTEGQREDPNVTSSAVQYICAPALFQQNVPD